MTPIEKVKASKAKCKRHRDNWKAKALKLERENAELRECLAQLVEWNWGKQIDEDTYRKIWKRAEALVAGKGGKGK